MNRTRGPMLAIGATSSAASSAGLSAVLVAALTTVFPVGAVRLSPFVEARLWTAPGARLGVSTGYVMHAAVAVGGPTSVTSMQGLNGSLYPVRSPRSARRLKGIAHHALSADALRESAPFSRNHNRSIWRDLHAPG